MQPQIPLDPAAPADHHHHYYRGSASVARRWTYGCGLLVLLSIGISVAAIWVALVASNTATTLSNNELGAQQRVLSLMILTEVDVLEASAIASSGTATSSAVAIIAECTQINYAERAQCVCGKFACSEVTGTCPLAPTARLAIACAPCDAPNLPCSLP